MGLSYRSIAQNLQIRLGSVYRVHVIRPDWKSLCIKVTTLQKAERSCFFVWLDGAGSDCRNHMCNFRYSLRGLTPACQRNLARGHGISSLAAISSQGVVAYNLISSMNGDCFFLFFLSEARLFLASSLSQPPLPY